jgi:hypothetical protein
MDESKASASPLKKIMRIALRVIAIVIGLYILLLVGLSIYISSSHERLISFLNTKLKETIIGELKVNKADITIWRTFPDIGITLNNVTISDSFYHKPFLKAEEITAKAGFLGLIGNKLKISSVEVNNAIIHTFTDAKGYTNTYVLRSQNKEKRQSKKPVILKNIELNNVTVVIEDAIKKKRYAGRIDDADINMRLSGSKYFITFNEDLFLRGLGFNLPQGYWLENKRIQAKWKLVFDTTGNVLTVNETKVKIQGQLFLIKGEFNFGKSHFQLNVVSKKLQYGSALAILKPRTREKLQKINLEAPVDITVALNGSLSKKGDPSVLANFTTTKCDITTPVLGLNDCDFSGTYTNQVNKNDDPDDSNSVVTFNTFTSNWGDVHLKAPVLTITNLINPAIKFEFFSACTLQQLDNELSSSTMSFEEGNAKLFLAYNGPLIADPSLLDRLNAKIQIENGKIVYVPRNLTFDSCNGTVIILGNTLTVNNFQCDLNTNHFAVNINGQNLNRLSDKEPGKATINCNVYSPAINLSDFTTLFAKRSSKKVKQSNKGLSATANAIDNAVENGDLFLGLKADKLSLNKFNASNVIANILFTNDAFEIQKASLLHADGSFNLTAKIHQGNGAYNQANIQTVLQNINVKKLFYAFDNFGQSSITSGNIKGVMNCNANITTSLSNTGKLLSSTLNGKLYFSLKNAALTHFQPLKNIQKYVFKNRDLDNVEFAELKDTFDITNGDIYIHRMPIQSSALTMYIEGIYSFGNKTDISIQVPVSTLTNKPDNSDFRKIDKAKAERPGTSIYLRAKDGDNGQLKIGLDLFGKHRMKKRDKDKDDDK